jgi:hypothetical protein
MTFANENVLFLNLPSIDLYRILLFYNDILQLICECFLSLHICVSKSYELPNSSLLNQC